MTLIEEKHKQELLLLRLFYGKIIEILDATKSGYVMFNDEILNHHYIQLTLSINTILKEKRFENLNKEAPQMFDSLLGNLEEIDSMWEYLKNDLLRFIGKIQRECVMANVINYTLPKEYKKTFDSIDKAIKEHKKNVKLRSEELKKAELPKLNKLKEQFNKYNNDFCDVDNKEINNKKNVYYEYNENEKMGTLIIKPHLKIKFSKTPALIIKYFFDSKDLDSNYKSYHDFQETHFVSKLTSDYFSKRIAKINEKVSRDTKNKIKQIICKDDKDKQKPTEINRYKWKIMT